MWNYGINNEIPLFLLAYSIVKVRAMICRDLFPHILIPLKSVRWSQVSINENEILKNLNLTVKKGEIHAIMGPNGSGKSTFSKH